MAADETPAFSGKRITFAISGGVAAYKAVEAVRGFVREGATVQTILTKGAMKFIRPALLEALTGWPCRTRIFSRVDNEGVGGYPHLDLARLLDLFVVAPATANAIYRLAHGAADDLLSATALSVRSARLLCPAMNVEMWNAPPVQRNIQILKQDGWDVMDPIAGELACGDTGIGRMVEPIAIVERGKQLIGIG